MNHQWTSKFFKKSFYSAFWFHGGTEADEDSEITFGGYRKERLEGAVTWLPVSSSMGLDGYVSSAASIRSFCCVLLFYCIIQVPKDEADEKGYWLVAVLVPNWKFLNFSISWKRFLRSPCVISMLWTQCPTLGYVDHPKLGPPRWVTNLCTFVMTSDQSHVVRWEPLGWAEFGWVWWTPRALWLNLWQLQIAIVKSNQLRSNLISPQIRICYFFDRCIINY